MNYLFLLLCTICASLGGLLAGYDTGVISGALLYINQSFELNSFLTGLVVGSVSLGAVIGALINGYLADLLGRKKILIIVAVVVFGLFIGLVAKFYADKKRGKLSCGCGCEDCSLKNKCHSKKDTKKGDSEA